MLSQDDLTIRYDRAQQALAVALAELQQTNPAAALCDLLEHELQLEKHEVAHVLLNTIEEHCSVAGCVDLMDCISLTFNMGRKFGMMEAADSVELFEGLHD